MTGPSVEQKVELDEPVFEWRCDLCGFRARAATVEDAWGHEAQHRLSEHGLWPADPEAVSD